MENKTHTPGPWAWRRFGDTYSLVADHGMREIIIGAIPHGQMKFPVVAMNLDGRLQDVDPNHPNAKLIASAPELLAERDQLKADLKLINDCWQADIKQISELNEQLRILGLQLRDQKLLEYEKSFIDHLKESNSKLLEAMQLFVDRIDHAEIRSSKEFKSLIEKYK